MIRRVWRAVVSPFTSWEEGAARLSIPIMINFVVLGAIRGLVEPTVSRLLGLLFAAALLYQIRQRDRARAEAARLWRWQP